MRAPLRGGSGTLRPPMAIANSLRIVVKRHAQVLGRRACGDLRERRGERRAVGASECGGRAAAIVRQKRDHMLVALGQLGERMRGVTQAFERGDRGDELDHKSVGSLQLRRPRV